MFSRIKKIFKEYKELKYLAYHDSLTGLLNRTWLYRNIDNIDKKYVYFIDINNLHEINKSGHTAGDEYIKKITTMIENNISTNDIFMRYAGDEFILFSDIKHILKSNSHFTIGMARVMHNNKLKSIEIADRNMLKNKK